MSDIEKLYVPYIDVNSDRVKILKVPHQNISRVSEGDLLVEFETSKAAIEFPAPKAGFVKVFVKENDELVPGSLIAVWAPAEDLLRKFVQNLKFSSNKHEKKNTESSLSLSAGARLELKKCNIAVEEFLLRCQNAESRPNYLTRSDVLKYIQSSPQPAPQFLHQGTLSVNENSINDTMLQTWNTTVPLWINTTIEADALLKKYRKLAEKNQLAGTLTELVMWAGIELVRTNEHINGFVRDGQIYKWKKKALAMVVRAENDTLLLPTIKTKDKPQTPFEIADQFMNLKRRIVTRKLSPEDLEGGGLLMSILEEREIHGFNALLAKNMSFALAISGPFSSFGKEHISITLTYDHKYVGGHVAATILKDYIDILKS